jgi:hypothetical protein
MSEDDKLFLAGRDSGKEETTKAWINKAEWELMKAFRHYGETKLHTFGMRQITDKDRERFNKEYAVKFPDNSKILKLNEEK